MILSMTRRNAFLIHFAISLLIFFVLLYFILVQWYPQPLFSTDGGWRVIRIIIGVDLVLGPLLTLIVFKPGKPGLKFDLSMIALIQTCALSWGVWTTYHERPAALIYTIDHFTPVPYYQLKDAGLTTSKLEQYGDSWPVTIYSDIPNEQKSKYFSQSIKEKKPLYLYTDLYTPFTFVHLDILKENAMRLEEYVQNKPKLEKIYQKALLNMNPAETDHIFLALHSREKWVTAVYDLNSQRIIDTLDIDPAQYTYEMKSKTGSKKE